MSQNYFQSVWESFTAKQKLEHFKCPFCGRRGEGQEHECDKVIMDGVNIGVQESRCKFTINPKSIFKDESVTVNMGRLPRTRFTHNVKAQKHLISLVVTQTGNFKRDCKISKLSSRGSQRILNWALNKSRYKSFANFLIWCSRIDDDKTIPESLFAFICFFFLKKNKAFFSFFFGTKKNQKKKQKG